MVHGRYGGFAEDPNHITKIMIHQRKAVDRENTHLSLNLGYFKLQNCSC